MAKQQIIPECAPASHPELDELADQYVNARDVRMAMLKEEVNKRDLLLIKMRELGLGRYEYGDRVVEVKAKEQIKVRAVEFNESDNGEEKIDDE